MHILETTLILIKSIQDNDLDVTDHNEMASHCLEGASDTLLKNLLKVTLLLLEPIFGCGSSRENAAIALK